MQKMEMEEKIDRLLEELTLEEKIRMIHGDSLFETGGVERLGIPPVKMSDGPMGVRCEFRKREWVLMGLGDDYVTYCPSNSALASTWNRGLAREAGRVLGREARGRGKDVILAPGINIKRTPLCGRNFEYVSEDPYLIAQMVVPLIQGIEEADVGACVKHFALNNQETERLWVNVEIEERTLREIYLPGFEAAVKKANVKSIMGAYNLFRGTHCCENKVLLGDILRKEWNYDGMIVSDWGGVHNTKAVAESPLDVEMSVTPDFDEYCMANPLLRAIRAGEVTESAIDEKVRNVLRFMLRTKMIQIVSNGENTAASVYALPDPERSAGAYNSPEHRQAVLDVAREAVVLLKNEEERLPLKRNGLKRILVVGDNAIRRHAYGGGSAEIKALYEITPLQGLKMLLGGNCEIAFAKGYEVPKKQEADKNWQQDSLEDATGQRQTEADRDAEEALRLRKEAVALAAEYEEVIFIGGLNHEEDVEGHDRTNMDLPYEQSRLIGELLEVNPNTVVVMMAGNPVVMEPWLSKAKAVVWTGYCGMEGGRALAEILLGEVNPSGKLAESLPYSMEDVPAIAVKQFPGRPLTEEEQAVMNAHLTETYEEGVFVGYRHYEKKNIPVQFCFGHGLSFTTFEYTDLQVTWLDKAGACPEKDLEQQILRVTVKVKNTGSCFGKETVQLYIGEAESSPQNPVKEMKGFEKIALMPGEEQVISLQLCGKDFAHYSEEKNAWDVQAGCYKLSVGSSLMDIRLQENVIINQ